MPIVSKIIQYLGSLLKENLGIAQKKPKIVSYLITDYCNSHCISCSAWKHSVQPPIELSCLENLLGHELFSEIQHVGISGGEPSTFESLEDYVAKIVRTLPNIKTLSITTNCINSDFWLRHLLSIYQTCSNDNVDFQLNISLDGVGKVHDRIRGTKGNFNNVEKVIEFSRINKIPFQLHSTISRYNVYHVGSILHYAKSIGAGIIFRLASEINRLSNEKQISSISLDDKQKSFFCDFLTSKDLLSYTVSPGRKLFYRSLARQILFSTGRKAPCYFKSQGIVLTASGNCSFCSRFSDEIGSVLNLECLSENFKNRDLFKMSSKDICQDCHHDQNGLWPLREVIKETFSNKYDKIRKVHTVSSNILKALSTGSKRSITDRPITQIAIIGMYGGEHVGDAAILGGVVTRLLQKYSDLQRIKVFSFRKDRTICWVDSLTKLVDNIELEVIGDESVFIKTFKESQLLVWAGGPLMELPVVLSRNYYFVRKAKEYGLDFEMVGIGYGPINSAFGKLLSRKILNESHYISVRSTTDFNRLRKYQILIDDNQIYDPAFDYLKLLDDNLEIEKERKREIDRLFDSSYMSFVAINLRPLWDRYGSSVGFDYDRFLDGAAKLIKKLSAKNIAVIFFPMNADRYGFSDLEVGYCLQDRLRNVNSFQIWETEPTINEVIYFLRKVDSALCMRYHAVIFALSQGVRTIGIDYSLEGKGKVSTLFENPQYCVPIKNFEIEKILPLLGW